MSPATDIRKPPAARPLGEIVAGLVAAPADLLIHDLTLDSRAATPGSMFLACRGRRQHGLHFAADAVARGAHVVLYESAPGERPEVVPQFGAGVFVAAVPQLAERAGLIAARFFGEPSRSLTVAGITGTNGKTTCAWLLAQALELCGHPAAYLGTLGAGVPPALTPSPHTTPDAVSLQRQLAAMRALDADCVCMEVSSHALDQHRVAGMRFNLAAFTNLTRDHLDYHGTMEAYGAAKAKLFSWPGLSWRVVNVDDAFGARLAGECCTAPLIATSRAPAAGGQDILARSGTAADARYVRAQRVIAEPSGLMIVIDSSWGAAELPMRLVGEFNADNALTVLAVLLAWEVPLARAVRALSECRAAPGRMELFGGRGAAPLAIVDYAHTPDALAKALRAARAHCRGELRVVFGCGGDRDAGKRALMGRCATELADDVIVTDDNPRTEDPARITAEILGGIAAPRRALIEHDRALAIRLALQRSGSEDVVLIAGKGHEDYQIYGTTRRPFRDQAIVTDELERGRG